MHSKHFRDWLAKQHNDYIITQIKHNIIATTSKEVIKVVNTR
jgi:hypothetical protein